MNTKELSKEIDGAVREYEQQMKTAQMMDEVRATKTRAEAQMAKEYERYKQALAEGNIKVANDSLKMFNFIYKLSELSDRFILTLERVQSIQDLFNILNGTSAIFAEIMSLDNGKSMRRMRRNLKLFKKKLRQYERQMDELFNFIDNLFDERPNFFVRLINKIRGKKEKTDAEILAENQAKIGENLAAYEARMGVVSSKGNSEPQPPKAAPQAPTEPKPLGSGEDVEGGI